MTPSNQRCSGWRRLTPVRALAMHREGESRIDLHTIYLRPTQLTAGT